MNIELHNSTLLGKLKFLVKDSVIYGGAGAINKFISLATFPLLTRYFSVQDYGLIDSYTVLASLLVTVLIFGQDSAVARYFYEYEDKEQKKEVISQSLLIQVITIIFILPILFFFSKSITELYVNEPASNSIFLIILFQIPFSLILNFSSNLLKWTFEKYKFLIITLGASASYLILTAGSILFLEITLIDVFKILLISQLIFSLIGLFFVKKWLKFRFTSNYIRLLLKYGIPYGIICVISMLSPAIDRLFISKFLTSETLGLYAVAFKIALLVNLPIQAFQTAWGPFYLSLHKEEDIATTYNEILVLYTIVFFYLFCFISFFSDFGIRLLSGIKYNDASYLVSFLVIVLIFRSLNSILGIGIDLSKKSYLKIYSYLLYIVCATISTYFFIQYFGVIGVCFALILSEILKITVEAYLSFKAYSIKFDFKFMVQIIVLYLISATIIYVVKYQYEFSTIYKVIIFSLILISPLYHNRIRVLVSKLFLKIKESLS